MNNYLALLWGTIDPPPGVTSWGSAVVGPSSGLQRFIQALIWMMIVAAGIYALINLILAGYSYMSAGGNPEKIAQAGSKIWQTIVGLLVVAGAFILAGVIGILLFGSAYALLQIRIFTP